MSDAQAIGSTVSFRRLLGRDASIVPATIVAIAATAFTVVSPTWLGRLPRMSSTRPAAARNWNSNWRWRSQAAAAR
jgi:hypothetical protein